MQELWMEWSTTVSAYLPRFAGAVGLLIGFWIVALILGAAFRGALGRTSLGSRLDEAMGKDRATGPGTADWVGRTVFYVVMLFGFIAFFNALGLALVAEPVNRMLAKVFEYAPRIASAGLLMLVGWVAARLVKAVTARALSVTKLDDRLGDSGGIPVSQSISGVAYWLILLLFLPLVLDALALRGLLDPIQGMLDGLLGFLPNLFAAGLILLIGWLVARILRQVVTNLLAAAGLDRATESFGKLGGTPLSAVIGTVVYALLLIPVVIASLDALQIGAVAQPATQMLATILEAVPSLLTGALVIAIAFFVGRFVSRLVSDILGRVGFDNLFVKMGFPGGAGERSPSLMVGTLVLVATIYLASMEAAGDLGLPALAGLLRDFAVFGGNILLGLVIFGLGLYLANLASGLVQSARGQSGGLMATAAKVSIILLSSAMALRQMGIAQDIVNIAFGLLLGAAAVAFALAFGLGARDAAARETERLVRSVKGE